jgi:hypothetical protein
VTSILATKDTTQFSVADLASCVFDPYANRLGILNRSEHSLTLTRVRSGQLEEIRLLEPNQQMFIDARRHDASKAQAPK